ncbi:cell envelope biogenesis protein OmpA [Bacteroidia bacterium]|nr:cell envelope biogenesis protein OmpA [Bacteroidia bacterium]
MKYIVYAVSFVLIALSTVSCGAKYALRKADRQYETGEYYAAANQYRKAYRSISAKDKDLRASTAFKMGNCYRLTGNSQRAEYAYQNAVRYNHKEDIAILYYAETLRKNAKYADAQKQYEAYSKKHPDDIWAQNGILSCQKIKEWQKEKTRFEIKKADVLNSRKFSEFSPAFSNQEGDVLYFNSSRENVAIGGKASKITGLRNNDFFVAKQNSAGKWETPTAIEGDLNTFYDEGTPSFTADGKTMYFTRCKTDGRNAQIYKSARAGAQWSAGDSVIVLKDSTLMAAHPAISPDGQTLYFVSDMTGGFGGKDIWKVVLLEGDKWGALENLGADINTAGDEMFPYVRTNGDLYFSSNGHPGFGGLDIFRAVPKGEGWEVSNMLTPINSAEDEFGITFAGKEEHGFFTSNRKEPKYLDKLWSFQQKKIEYFLYGWIKDTKNEALEDAALRIVGDDGTNKKIAPQHKDGAYRFELKEGVNYVMMASARGFLNSKETVSTEGLTDGKDFQINFKLASISKPVQMDNIFYEFGKWTLTPDSEAGIKSLAKLLTDNPNITMEISAHTDRVGSNEANMELSNKRAQEVVNYLIRAGIESERLTPVGYGEEQPVVVSKDLAQQYKFLKEGDVLDEEYVLNKSPEEQESINQINRRTEFKVLKTTYKMY